MEPRKVFKFDTQVRLNIRISQADQSVQRAQLATIILKCANINILRDVS